MFRYLSSLRRSRTFTVVDRLACDLESDLKPWKFATPEVQRAETIGDCSSDSQAEWQIACSAVVESLL